MKDILNKKNDINTTQIESGKLNEKFIETMTYAGFK